MQKPRVPFKMGRAVFYKKQLGGRGAAMEKGGTVGLEAFDTALRIFAAFFIFGVFWCDGTDA